MAEWWSIEVLHGGFSAFRWQEQHDSALIEAALTNALSTGRGMRTAGAWCSRSALTMRSDGSGSAACRPSAQPWTACRIPLTACLSNAAGAAERGTASRASRSRRRTRAPSRCLSRRRCRIWTSPASRRRIRCLPGRQKRPVPDQPYTAWDPVYDFKEAAEKPRRWLYPVAALIPARASRGLHDRMLALRLTNTTGPLFAPQWHPSLPSSMEVCRAI
jgi:hypothetical protein